MSTRSTVALLHHKGEMIHVYNEMNDGGAPWVSIVSKQVFKESDNEVSAKLPKFLAEAFIDAMKQAEKLHDEGE